MGAMSEHWTQEHYVVRNSTTDDPSGYRVWLTCRCGWDSGTLPDGNLPTTHRQELEHYVSVAPLASIEREAGARALEEAANAWQINGWAQDMPAKDVERPQIILHMAQAATEMLRARAAEIREGQ